MNKEWILPANWNSRDKAAEDFVSAYKICKKVYTKN